METIFFESIEFSYAWLGAGPGAARFRASLYRFSCSIRNILAMFWVNSPTFWNKTYGSGYWEFLQNKEQRPRHYVIPGLVRDYFPEKVSIMEVGCGYAPVLPLLLSSDVAYLGVDLSEEVIGICKTRFPTPKAKFVAGNFEELGAIGTFDVLLTSEVLYYFPLSAIAGVLEKLQRRLKPGGILVVTMNKNPKSYLIWLILSRKLRCIEKMATMNSKGSKWTIGVFQAKEQFKGHL